MSYCDTQQASWNDANIVGTSTEEVRVARPDPRADHIACQPVRCNANACSRQPSLIAVIADELSKIHGGATAEHLSGARRLLEEAFRAIEQVGETAGIVSGRTSCGIRGGPSELEPAYAQ